MSNDETQTFHMIPPGPGDLHGTYIPDPNPSPNRINDLATDIHMGLEGIDDDTRGKLAANARALLDGQAPDISGSPLFEKMAAEGKPLPQRKPMTSEFFTNERPKAITATICGSMRFYDEIMAVARDLTLNGLMVLAPFIDMDYEQVNRQMDPETAAAKKRELDWLHLQKIQAASEIHVVTVDGYVGTSTQEEISYAASLGKKIYWHEMGRPQKPIQPEYVGQPDFSRQGGGMDPGPVDVPFLPDPHLTYDDVLQGPDYDDIRRQKADDQRNAEMTAMMDRTLDPQTRPADTQMMPMQGGDIWQDETPSGETRTVSRHRRGKRGGNSQ